MKLSEIDPPRYFYTQLSSNVLAVLSRRIDGWCVYVDAVPGYNHDEEWRWVADHGNKQRPAVAKAIAENLFFPGFDCDLPYAG